MSGGFGTEAEANGQNGGNTLTIIASQGLLSSDFVLAATDPTSSLLDVTTAGYPISPTNDGQNDIYTTAMGIASASLAQGALHLASTSNNEQLGPQNSAAGVSVSASFGDTITIQGAIPTPTLVTITLTGDGYVSSLPPIYGSATVAQDNQGFGAFSLTVQNTGGPTSGEIFLNSFDGTNINATGDTSNQFVNASTVAISSSGAGEIQFVITSTVLVTDQDRTIGFDVEGELEPGTQDNGGIDADFGDTASLGIDLPAGLSYTSASGVLLSAPLCFAAGSRVATPTGERAVETLYAGDAVIAVDPDGTQTVQKLRWVGRRRLDLRAHPDPEMAAPVRLRTGAIAPGVPARDVVLSPDHCVFLEGQLLRAFRLINGASVVQETPRHVTYVHLELDRHTLLLAEGMAAESYLDEGCRGFFAGEGGCPAPLGPRLPTACAPFVSDDRAAERLWRGVAARAGLTGRLLAPAARQLRVLAADRTLVPVAVQGGRHVYALPRNTRQLRLRSGTARPTTAQPWRNDRRALGVLVRRIMLDGTRAVAVDDPGLETGWWRAEPGPSRWTAGDAVLDLPPCVLSVALEIEQ